MCECGRKLTKSLEESQRFSMLFILEIELVYRAGPSALLTGRQSADEVSLKADLSDNPLSEN